MTRYSAAMRNQVSAAVLIAAAIASAPSALAQRSSHPLIDLWSQSKPAFGVFVPNEAPRDPNAGPGRGGPGGSAPGGAGQGPRAKPVYTEAGGEKLAANSLYDYVFLNLEGAYDSAAVKAMATGLRKGATAMRRVSLIVRVPAFHEDAAAGRVRIREVFAAGGDGITFPHVETLDEAKQILAAAQAEKINVWSPGNPKGDKILMMMLEDPAAVAQAAEFASLKGYSLLACGIGSLRGALKGDAAGAEAGVQKVLAETKRVKLVNMLTATSQDVEQRVKEGFLGILAQGQDPDGAIKIGRAVAAR
jgi:HpcH/HpaI aldolase/citrate lyase family